MRAKMSSNIYTVVLYVVSYFMIKVMVGIGGSATYRQPLLNLALWPAYNFVLR